jgi:hypothetical protein
MPDSRVRRNGNWAEEVYFSTYAIATNEAEALQPSTIDQLLPEAIISAFAATLITSFLGGYLGEAGKDLWAKTKSLMTPRGNMRNADPEVLIELLIEYTPE